MNELRADHERQMYDLSNSQNNKFEQQQLRFEQEKKRAIQKLKDEIQDKNNKIKEMERQIQKDKALREKADSSIRQTEELKDTLKSLKTDRDVIK